MKPHSTFYHDRAIATVRANIGREPLLAAFARAVEERAAPWRAMPDAQLWGLMFGPTLPRSWMVWSDGHCPACTQPVPMYEWKINALAEPWKVACPHCAERFPKNDFGAFYRSGLDARGVFDPAKADRALLFNAEHPDAGDPRRGFGVDDGAGFSDGQHRWRFIGAYLVYGQWKQAVLAGINHLAAAYVVSGDAVYARKAAILLDRVADLYPGFDFKEQAVVYERALGSTGYVSTWHDACEETREMALAYDMIFTGIQRDQALVAFLSQQATAHGLANPKATVADIARNIEAGLLRDPLDNPEKIHSNFPRTEICKAVLEAVLDWPGYRAAVMARIDDMVAQSTRVDGVTGEKGLSGYTAYTLAGLAQFLQQMSLADPELLRGLLARHPALAQTWRFHIDTYCRGFYPSCGDAGWFAGRTGKYMGMVFQRYRPDNGQLSLPAPPLAPSLFSFCWQLTRITGDPGYAQALYQANDGATDHLPWDPFCADPEAVRRGVAEVIAAHGAEFAVGSLNKEAWHLALLRSGTTTAWLDYDWGGLHAHSDGMTLGLFAYGLDLLPDYGYPPVNHGGWDSVRAKWYTLTEAHNTVTVDGQSVAWAQQPLAGMTTLWADGQAVRAVRASAKQVYADTAQCERTVFLIDLAPARPILFDIFRVAGGRDHLKVTGSAFGPITTQGLRTEAEAPPNTGAQVRHLRTDPAPAPGWSVDWAIEDRYGYREPGADVHLRYTDLTEGAQATLGEAWVVPGGYAVADEAWVSRAMTRRQAAFPLHSTFVGVLEPYEKRPTLQGIRRLPVTTAAGEAFPDAQVAVEVTVDDGARGLLLAVDAENPFKLVPGWTAGEEVAQPAWGVALRGEACWLQRDAQGRLTRAALFRGTRLAAPGFTLATKRPVEFLEIAVVDGRPRVVAGEADAVAELAMMP